MKMLTHEEGQELGYPPSNDYEQFLYEQKEEERLMYGGKKRSSKRSKPNPFPKYNLRKSVSKPAQPKRKKKTPMTDFSELCESDQKILLKFIATGMNQA